MIHLMRGTPYVYQGEKIGMVNAHFPSIEQYRDVESLNYYEILLERGKTKEEALEVLSARSRDNSRTPMQWTVEAQQRDPDSILAFYKKLIAMRKQYGVIADGVISFLETGTDMVLAYRRTLGEQGLDVFCNLEEKEHPINLSGLPNADSTISV